MSLLLSIYGSAQSAVILSEDFESSPINTFSQTFGGDIADGSPDCSEVSRGWYPDFMSVNVDMSGNSTAFLGANPESPCGGHYDATVQTELLDLSGGTDSNVITFDYYIGADLGWGDAGVSDVIVENSEITVLPEPTITSVWSSFSIKLPDSVAVEDAQVSITLGGGDGVAIDNFKITSYGAVTAVSPMNKVDISVFPNPVVDQINWEMDGSVTMVRVLNSDAVQLISIGAPVDHSIDVSHLEQGSYILIIETNDGESHKSQFIK